MFPCPIDWHEKTDRQRLNHKGRCLSVFCFLYSVRRLYFPQFLKYLVIAKQFGYLPKMWISCILISMDDTCCGRGIFKQQDSGIYLRFCTLVAGKLILLETKRCGNCVFCRKKIVNLEKRGMICNAPANYMQ